MGVTAQALHGAKVCLIPQPENNYQPLALRRKVLMAVSGLIVTAKVAAIALALLLPTTAELSTITTARILQLTNEARVKNGLSPLQENASLSKAAAGKAKDIIDNDYFAHISPSGVTPWFWMQQQSYSYSVAGENLAIDFVQAEDVVNAWLASPSHKENMLHTDYTETGMAVLTGEYQGGTSTVVVHMFGLPLGASRPSQSSSLSARSPVEESTPSIPTPVKAPEPIIVPEPIKTPPAIPNVQLAATETVYRDEVGLNVTADAGSIVKIVINDLEVASLEAGVNGRLVYNADVSGFDDGQLTIQAYATDENGLESKKSTPVEITKDTTGPSVSDEGMMFMVAPETDTPHILMYFPRGDYKGVSIKEDDNDLLALTSPLPEFADFELTSGTIEVAALDEVGNTSVVSKVDLLPAIATDREMSTGFDAQRFNSLARRMVVVVTIILLVLLLLTILIKVRIQHPRMITHTSLVLLLALVLLFV